MPFPDNRFDLVLNCHEAYHPTEVARILRPGGVFVTQQVGSGELAELDALTDHPPALPDVRYGPFRAVLEAADLTVTDGAEAVGHYVFEDVAALVAYLQLVPWTAPDDFTVDGYADALWSLHAARRAASPFA